MAGTIDTRETILLRSIELFASQGYGPVSTSQICQACGITKPSLYYHFASKSQLLEQVYRRALDRLLEDLGGWPQYSRDLVADIESLFCGFFRFNQLHPGEHRMISSAFLAGANSDEFEISSDIRSELGNLCKAFFVQAASDHGNLKDKQALLTASFLSQALMLSVMFPQSDSKFSHEQYVHLTAKNFMHGIFA